jgi:hypothetical protein
MNVLRGFYRRDRVIAEVGRKKPAAGKIGPSSGISHTYFHMWTHQLYSLCGRMTVGFVE